MPHERRISGGHVVQLEETARSLRRLGIDARTDFSTDPDPTDVSLVHGFGLNAADVHQWRWRGIPVVLSSIYWDQRYRAEGGKRRLGARAAAGRARRATQFALAALRGNWPLVDACLRYVPDELRTLAAFEAADLLLPNGVGEAVAIRRDLGVTTPIQIVPNGVDPARFAEQPSATQDRNSVVCLGRIEPHKNQLGLIEALRGTGLRLVIAGYAHPDHLAYADRCRAAGAGWVDVRGEVSDDDAAALLRSAKVHVLASWFETTGLVSLEAALAGCNVVSTDRGYAREYLGDWAWYCDPADPASIRRAVTQAWQAPPQTALRDHVLAHYTWDHVGRATVAAYEALLGDGPAPELPR
jgi:glycosyltransferase involved in cell wall biosynthesis